jgi:hypothetical protein
VRGLPSDRFWFRREGVRVRVGAPSPRAAVFVTILTVYHRPSWGILARLGLVLRQDEPHDGY